MLKISHILKELTVIEDAAILLFSNTVKVHVLWYLNVPK